MASQKNKTSPERERRCNGWTNDETWVVAIWIRNHVGSRSYWREQATRQFREASNSESVRNGLWSSARAARFQLASQLKEEIQSAVPMAPASVYLDLLRMSLDSVNWHEIADNLLYELDR